MHNGFSKYQISRFISNDPEVINDALLIDENFLRELENTQLGSFFEALSEHQYEVCTTRSIPQFSSIESAIIYEVDYLAYSGASSFEKIGSVLPGQYSSTVGAHRKYGENHSKLLESFGLAVIDYSGVYLSPLGMFYSEFNNENRQKLVSRLVFKIPIMRNILYKSMSEEVSISDELSKYLSASTVKRRLPNVRRLVHYLYDYYDGSFNIGWLERIKK